MKNAARTIRTVLPLLGALLLGGWLLGQSVASGPPAGQTAWTAQSHERTNFPLAGKHRTTACRECHLKGVFEGTPKTCEACHWQRRQDDRYQGRLGMHCADCHTPDGWKDVKPARWNHEPVTGFRLAGAHRGLDCAECHGDGGFRKAAVDCYACHAADYKAARNPNHGAANFPPQCLICHPGGASWKAAHYTHQYPLRGRHLLAACSDCHGDGLYAGRPSTCVSCHLSEYNGTNNPNHKQAGYSLDCRTCHGEGAQSWAGATFDHAKFALLGKHKLAACADCHKNGQFAGISSACVSCHLNDYNGTSNPNHRQAGYSTDCAACHGGGAQGWTGANPSHDRFVLNGKHKLAACTDCHKNGQFAGTSSACVSCHLNEYNGTSNPNHKLAGYSTDCASCHGTGANSWTGAAVDHSKIWPLQGPHQRLDCNACHSKGYGLPTNCYGCHAADYDATTNPNHKAAGYPTNCESCHYPTHLVWTQAVFNHSFPIKSGRHANFSCSDCHLTTNYNQFSCIDCHTHSKSSVDSRHGSVKGYSYNSQACYSCHPNGRA